MVWASFEVSNLLEAAPGLVSQVPIMSYSHEKALPIISCCK